MLGPFLIAPPAEGGGVDGNILVDDCGANHAIAADPHVLPEPR